MVVNFGFEELKNVIFKWTTIILPENKISNRNNSESCLNV